MRIIIIALIFIGGVIAAYIITKPSDEKQLKIYNPIDIQPEMVDRDLVRIGFGHKITPFEFLDQTGKIFASSQLKGKVYVAEYFFTTCGTICPKMNAQMQRVQEAMKTEREFAILSFTVDPEVDTVEQLNRYATAHNANPKQWHFLTGEKKNLYRLARRSFFVLKPAEVKNQGDVGSDFIHTNHFVLVDQQSRIRGYYDGTNEQEVNALIHDAQHLLSAGKN
jgi:protein SCO1/2